MKKFTAGILLCFTFFSSFSQSSNTELAKHLKIFVGSTFGKPSILPKADKLAIVQLVVKFKQFTTKSETKSEKKIAFAGGRKSAKGVASSFLEFTDAIPSDADYQAITDHFYKYFQAALKRDNVDTVAWTAVTNTEFYKDGKERPENDDDKNDKSSTFFAHNGNSMFNGGQTAFAFGKIKKASRFSEELGAPVAFIYTTVDFADLNLDVKVKSVKTGYSWDAKKDGTMNTLSTQIIPSIKVAADGGPGLLWDQKSRSEVVGVIADIPSGVAFADKLETKPDMKSKKFHFTIGARLETDPVVIYTTKEKYLAAAKKALENYADAFVAQVKN